MVLSIMCKWIRTNTVNVTNPKGNRTKFLPVKHPLKLEGKKGLQE